jgi:hypothetical protein
MEREKEKGIQSLCPDIKEGVAREPPGLCAVELIATEDSRCKCGNTLDGLFARATRGQQRRCEVASNVIDESDN